MIVEYHTITSLPSDFVLTLNKISIINKVTLRDIQIKKHKQFPRVSKLFEPIGELSDD